VPEIELIFGFSAYLGYFNYEIFLLSYCKSWAFLSIFLNREKTFVWKLLVVWRRTQGLYNHTYCLVISATCCKSLIP
jgi:hypothetical protein